MGVIKSNLSSEEPSIKLNSITKSYKSHTVLNDITLEVPSGVIYGLIGPSGAGKTTLIKLLIGSETSSSGTVSVNQIAMPNVKALQEIGYMAQANALYEDLTGFENLNFFASLYKIKSPLKEERIKYVSELVHLEHDLTKSVRHYSGGMQRRLSLAIALLHDPPLLILDEPTVGLDPVIRASIWSELNKLVSTSNKTIVVTTHVMDEAMKCHQLALLREGRILASGSVDALLKHFNVCDLESVFLAKGEIKHEN